MSEAFPSTGLFVSEQALTPEIVEALSAVRLEAEGWSRLRAGGAAALSVEHEAWMEACRPSPGALAAGATEIARLRQAMVDAVVPPAIGLLSLACALGLGLFAAGFVWPPARRWAFAGAGVVVVLMVVWATARSLRSSRTQRQLQDALHEAGEKLTALRREGDRPRLLALALDLEHKPREPASVRWQHPAADPQRPLVLPRDLLAAEELEVLLKLARARAVVVEGTPVLDHPEAHPLSF